MSLDYIENAGGRVLAGNTHSGTTLLRAIPDQKCSLKLLNSTGTVPCANDMQLGTSIMAAISDREKSFNMLGIAGKGNNDNYS